MENIDFKEADFSPQHFEVGDKIYRYNFDKLTIIQAEYAKEVGIFKHQQQQREPTTFLQVEKSGGIGWVLVALSYLLTPVASVEDVEQEAFDLKKVKAIELELSTLLIADRMRVDECVSNFFTNIGQGEMLLSILEIKKSSPTKQILLEGLAKGIMNTKNVS